MKKKFFMAATVAVAAVTGGLYGYRSQSVNDASDTFLANVEALARLEDSDCHYSNGYTAFTDKPGSGYDCCRVWVEHLPKDEHCR